MANETRRDDDEPARGSSREREMKEEDVEEESEGASLQTAGTQSEGGVCKKREL